jgi:hypothetical protein
MSRYSRKTRYIRAFIPTLITFLLSLAADFVIHFTLGFTIITSDNFKGSFSIYLLLISLPIGAIFGLLACFFTRKSYEAHEHAGYLAFARVIILWILSLVGVFVHDNWVPQNTLDPSGAAGNVFAFVLIVGAIFLAGQLFAMIGTLLIKQPVYDGQSVPSSSSSSSSSNSSSRSGVEDTQWYKDKVEDYYNQYMGYSPKERKPTWSDEEMKKFSDIVDNQ